VDVRSGATPSKDEPLFWDGNIPWVSPKDMKVLRIGDSEDHVSEAALSSSALRWIAEGSVLMVTRGMILDHTVPIALVERRLTINQDMKALVPRGELCGDFLMWLLVGLNPAILARVEEAAHGTKVLRTEQWRKLPLAIPPEDTQQRIAAFLDAKTAAIDALIAKKEQLLMLLEERRASAIERALLTANGPRTKLGYLVDVQPGYAFSSEGFLRGEDGVRLLRGVNVAPNEIRWTETVRWNEEDLAGLHRYALQVGDIIFGMDRPWIGAGARVATLSAADVPAYLVQRVLRLRAGTRIRRDYLRLVLASRAFRAYVEPDLTGVSVPHVSDEQVRFYRFVLPSLEDQDRVCDLASRLDEVDRIAVPHLKGQINKLREYRQALIAAAVTGKLDVKASSTTPRALHQMELELA